MIARTGAPQLEGSSLCLACGLCCEGVLHAQALVRPNEIEPVRALGLSVETCGADLWFRLPCPLYQDNRCSIYAATRPQTCVAYRCRLLDRYLAGEVTREQGVQIVQRTRTLLADVLQQLPAGYSFGELRKDLERNWDSGRGVAGSAGARQGSAALLLAVARLAVYLRRHFKAQAPHDTCIVADMAADSGKHRDQTE